MKLQVMDLGLNPYRETWDFQKELHRRRVRGEIPDTLILVEHPHVYTFGKNAEESNLIATPTFLQNRGVEVVKVDRGGDITYHGPGQIVGYPIFNLKDHNMGVKKYVENIEQAMIDTCTHFGIKSRRLEGLTGVWVGTNKIAAIGIRVSRWSTYHGFALNVETDLLLYSGIIPCGILDKGVCRMMDLNPDASVENVKQVIIDKFQKIFGFDKVIEDNPQRCEGDREKF
ncbi:MAG: lipoyl(octanoyl) transferase LipB [Candidatus Marinimicrobia bacterium]|nr:lipoyl(octanoyl) transferase LipB [Candidatus Neomarinimicrobiota bacterium]